MDGFCIGDFGIKRKKYSKELSLRKISILFIISVFVEIKGGDLQCIPDFESHKIRIKNPTEELLEDRCVKVFEDKLPWDGAAATCQIHFSLLMEKISEHSSLHEELTNKSIALLWVGIHRQADFFVRISFDLFEEKENEWGYRWSTGEPRRSDCVALNVTDGSLLTRDCKDRLPFICENGNATSVYNDTVPLLACPENWELSVPLAVLGRRCVSNGTDARPYSEAENFCKKNLGRLATIKEYDILISYNFLPPSLEDTAYWINKEGNKTCPFKVIFGNGNSTEERPRSCSKPLQFLCVRDFEMNNVSVGIDTNDKLSRPSACKLEDDILSCAPNATGGNLNDRRITIWYSDDVPIHSCKSQYTCKVGFVQAARKMDRYSYVEENQQGSYHCEVSFQGLVKTYSSHKIDVFFSNIATYIVDVSGIGLNSVVDYSHHNSYSYLQDVSSRISSIFKKENLDNSNWDLQRISIGGETATMKIFVYINRTILREFDDEKVYNKLKKVFEENVSALKFEGKLSVSVKSADVCFKEKVKPSETCNNNLEWPTSVQGKKIMPTKMCFDESMKPLYRECKGSAVNSAKWSNFSCSSCKEFLNRFQDLPFECPNKYNKFREKNLCFRSFTEKKNWYDAYKTCADSSSYLLDEPSDEIELGDIWLSYRYSNGKIQGVGIKPLNLKLENMTVGSNELHCVSAVLKNNAYTLKLENCSKEISFVCIQNPYELVSSVRFLHTWTKVHSQEACYYFDKTAAFSWTKSVNMCKQTFHGADLLNGNQTIETYSYLKKLIHQEFNETSCQPLKWWMNITRKDGLFTDTSFVDWSPYIDINVPDQRESITLYPDKKIYWTLDKAVLHLKLACEIQKCEDNRPTQAYIEDRTKPEGSSSFGDYYNYVNSFKLRCIPSGWFIANSMQWYKDGVLLNVLSQELSFNLSSNMSDARQVIAHEALKHEGYYSCSVDEFIPRQTIYSSEHLFKLPGIHTFVLSMVSQDKYYLTDCFDYAFHQKSLENTLLKACFDNFNPVLNSFHFLLKNLTCNSTRVNITVHVHFEAEEGEEEIILRRIREDIQKDDFREFCRVCDIHSDVIARSTAACYHETTKIKNFDVTWPTTPIGKTAYPKQMCLTDENTRIQRRCLGDFNSGAVWSDISVDECRYITSSVTIKLDELLNEVEGGSYESLSHLPNIIASPQELEPIDLQLTIQIFENVANQSSVSLEELKTIVSAMSNLIDAKPEVFNAVENSSNQITEYFEQISSITDIEDKNANATSKNILVDIHPLNLAPDTIPNCKILSNGEMKSIFNASADSLQDNTNDMDAGVVLPYSLITENSNVSDRLVYAIYENFYHVKNLKVLSSVIHVSLPNVPVYDLGQEEITLFFKLREKIDIKANNTPKCVFWDHKLNNWSYKGCFRKEIHENSLFCICNHLTSFSVILEIDSTQISFRHKAVLHFITYIGCSLSCIGFCLIIMTFICFREWRKSIKNKALLNYSVSQFVFLFIFMVFIKQTSLQLLCKVTTILLHYFLLSSFAWMIMLAYAVYLSLVKVLDTYIPRLIQKFMAIAWGLPAIIVFIIWISSHEYYSRDYCWLSKDVALYGVIIPLTVMLSINFSIFGAIFYVNMCKGQHLNINQDRRKLVIARAKALLCTSILLGLSWIFGFLAIREAKLIFEYLFSIITPLQGFLLAIFFVARQKSTRERWLKFFHSSSSSKSSAFNTINSLSVSHRANNCRRSQCENMLNSVVYKAHSPDTPYA